MNQEISNVIQKAIPDAETHVLSPDGVHFQAVVVSASFEGQPLVRQHQQVMNALKEHFDSERVHALQLKTFTPARWQENKHLYPING